MKVQICGHTAHGNGFAFSCDKPEGHIGLHEQRDVLMRSNPNDTYVERTNWGDDGLAPWATKDKQRLVESGWRR